MEEGQSTKAESSKEGQKEREIVGGKMQIYVPHHNLSLQNSLQSI